jgi:hypothetical protein
MKPNRVALLEFVWNLMMIMVLLVLGIGFLQNIMDMLFDVSNPFNEPVFFFGLHASMRRLSLCGFKGRSYINGDQWLKPQASLKWAMASRAMNSSVVVVLYIRKVVIPYAWIFGVLNLQDMHDHPIDHLYLHNGLGMESSGFGELGVQQCP